MLVLSRQRDETIMIGDEIEITVVDIRGDKVRLGITAPTKISVHRKEVYDAIRAENARASQIASSDVAALKVATIGRPARPAAPETPGPGAARAMTTPAGPTVPVKTKAVIGTTRVSPHPMEKAS